MLYSSCFSLYSRTCFILSGFASYIMRIVNNLAPQASFVFTRIMILVSLVTHTICFIILIVVVPSWEIVRGLLGVTEYKCFVSENLQSLLAQYLLFAAICGLSLLIRVLPRLNQSGEKKSFASGPEKKGMDRHFY